jgi:hypothetical protein
MKKVLALCLPMITLMMVEATLQNLLNIIRRQKEIETGLK